MTPRERLKAKIAALLAKTRAAGCTEAEAMAAAAVAARLMAEHAFDQAEIEMTEASAPDHTRRPGWRDQLSNAIAYVTNTATMTIEARAEILFVGREPGPDIAAYLRDVCIRAVVREVQAFKETPFYRRRRKLATRRTAVADFISGMVIRLTVRLTELFKPVISQQARAEAQQAVARRFPKMVTVTAKQRDPRFSQATAAGWGAGGQVGLHHAVAGTAAPKLIGGGS